MVTPAPKVHPPEKLEDLRKISWLINCSEVADKLIVELVMEDMKPTLDSRAMRRNNCKKVKKSELPMDIHSICEEIRTGDGWVLLPDIFSQQIIEAAKDVVIKKEFEKETDHSDNDASQNNYSGLS